MAFPHVLPSCADTLQPGTPLFQRYARCPWHLKISAGELDYTSPVSSFFANLSPGSAPEYSEPTQHLSIPVSSAPATEGKKKKRGGSPSTPTGTSVTSTETQIKLNGKAIDDKTKKLGNGQPAAADAMVLDRMGEGGLEGVTGLSTSSESAAWSKTSELTCYRAVWAPGIDSRGG